MDNAFSVDRTSWMRRLGWKLLPPSRLGAIGAQPPGFEDALIVDTEVHFGWSDRIRVLFGGRLLVRSVSFTQHRPGLVYPGVTSVSTA